MGVGTACALLVPSPVKALILPRSLRERTLNLHNTHTGEFFSGAYWANGSYIPEALQKINHFLRDWRTDGVHSIDTKLVDLIHGLKMKLGYTRAMDIICGYRSPQTNRMLAKKSRGVAKKSLHLEGRAIDIRFPPGTLKNAHRAACSFRAGGVGLYSKSRDRFVHMDVRPRVVYWGV
jgi:uncharacterized protein YcbK (DUF882 family)